MEFLLHSTAHITSLGHPVPISSSSQQNNLTRKEEESQRKWIGREQKTDAEREECMMYRRRWKKGERKK